MPSQLKTHQRTELARLAREAWTVAVERGEERDFETWRHDEVEAECAKRGLRCCNQDDYAGLKARFLDGAGHVEAALDWRLRAQGNNSRVARFKLTEALRNAGLDEAYAAAICRSQNKCDLAEATERQLWRLVFTINNRATATRRDELHESHSANHP